MNHDIEDIRSLFEENVISGKLDEAVSDLRTLDRLMHPGSGAFTTVALLSLDRANNVRRARGQRAIIPEVLGL